MTALNVPIDLPDDDDDGMTIGDLTGVCCKAFLVFACVYLLATLFVAASEIFNLSPNILYILACQGLVGLARC